jgi:uncharacterized protein (DUF2252 family)
MGRGAITQKALSHKSRRTFRREQLFLKRLKIYRQAYRVRAHKIRERSRVKLARARQTYKS